MSTFKGNITSLTVGEDVDFSELSVTVQQRLINVTALTFPPVTPDTVRERIYFPAAGAIKGIQVSAIADAPTAGTIAFQKGIGAGGATLLSAATFDLSTLVANSNPGDNNKSAMGLTVTPGDLQGGAGDGVTIEVAASDKPIGIAVTFSL
jgi:hypothetical protein